MTGPQRTPGRPGRTGHEIGLHELDRYDGSEQRGQQQRGQGGEGVRAQQTHLDGCNVPARRKAEFGTFLVPDFGRLGRAGHGIERLRAFV